MGILLRCFVLQLLSRNYASWHGAGAGAVAEAADAVKCTAPPPRDACEASGAANRLNDLFNANIASFRTSGLFFHGMDCGLGGLMDPSGDIACEWRCSPFGSKLPPWSLGWESGTDMKPAGPDPDAVCPTFNVDDATEQPPWDYPCICPTPRGVSLGSVSFTYSRADLGTPRDIIDAILASDLPLKALKARPVWGPIGMVLTGTPLKTKADCPQFEPGAEFWDQGRVRGWFTKDGGSFGKDACGVGYHMSRIGAGIPNRNDGLPGVSLTAYPHGELESKERMSQLAGPWDTKEFWCPSSGMSTLGDGNPYCSDQIDSPEAFYEYWKNTTDAYYSEVLKPFNATVPHTDVQEMTFCALDEGRFELYTQAQLYENYPQFYKNRFDPNHPDFAATSDRGNYGEAVIRSFEGVRIKDIVPYLALYYLDERSEDGTVDRSGMYMDDRRREIYSVASAIYARTGISVPVVGVDPEGLYLEDGVVQRPVECGVPPEEPTPSDFRVDPPPEEEEQGEGGGADDTPSLGTQEQGKGGDLDDTPSSGASALLTPSVHLLVVVISLALSM